MWYYEMPHSIVCREGTHFSTACQVKVPCEVETEVDWYWSPLGRPDLTHLITDSNPSGARVRSSSTPCHGLNSTSTRPYLHHFYTLTLTGLSSENAGYYWCQMRVVDEWGSASGDGAAVPDILPSNRCYVGIAAKDMREECEYDDHSDVWRCAQGQTPSGGCGSTARSELVTATQSTVSTMPFPTVNPAHISEDSLLYKMRVTVIEAALIVVVLICMLIIAVLIGCLTCKRRKTRKRGRYILIHILYRILCAILYVAESTVVRFQRTMQDKAEEEKSTAPDEIQPRYTPVNTLTHAYSVPQLVSEWCRGYSNNAPTSEDPIYSSPYQHLDAASMDYTSMYSKPHQYSHCDVRMSKSAKSKNSSL